MKKAGLTKVEVARGQLVTAIRLFFEDADGVSVYTLAHAAREVLDALCKHQGKMRIRDLMANANKLPEKEIKKIANYGKNFFKHADKDPYGILEDFSDDRNDHVLILASMDFGTISPTKPIEVQLYPLWYFAVYPEKAPMPDFQSILQGAKQLFPNVARLNRKKQKSAGRKVLRRLSRDPTLTK